MKRISRMVRTVVFTVLLVVIAAFAISGTVFCQKDGTSKEMQEYYKTMEQEYVKEIRTFLAEKGYSDSGVTMNRIINEDGSREYLVTIHHKKISRLEEEQKEALLASCKEITFPDKDCGFCHKFLEMDL